MRLADRSSRRFRLTDEGLLLYDRSRTILEQVRDAEAEVTSRGGVARGLLKVGAPTDLGQRHLSPSLASFVAQHPGLDAHLILSDAGLENEADARDVVLRFGLPNDPGMIARKIATTIQVAVAAPSYVAKRGAPISPEELKDHNCLRLARRHRVIDVWRFTRGGEKIEVSVNGNLTSADGAVLRAWALSGEGVSWEALWDVADDLSAGGSRSAPSRLSGRRHGTVCRIRARQAVASPHPAVCRLPRSDIRGAGSKARCTAALGVTP